MSIMGSYESSLSHRGKASSASSEARRRGWPAEVAMNGPIKSAAEVDWVDNHGGGASCRRLPSLHPSRRLGVPATNTRLGLGSKRKLGLARIFRRQIDFRGSPCCIFI